MDTLPTPSPGWYGKPVILRVTAEPDRVFVLAKDASGTLVWVQFGTAKST